ncbi:MAG: hypothetical protein CSA38_01850 [Flavobacteriales bacterium]|nr:MAG: hypothetical protein CSA38_01850 [Flavobacteriales bacterium]
MDLIEKNTREIYDYFKTKILKNEFEIMKVENHGIKVCVDDKYLIVLWTANGISHLRIYGDITIFDSVKLECFSHFTKGKQRRIAWDNLHAKKEIFLKENNLLNHE